MNATHLLPPGSLFLPPYAFFCFCSSLRNTFSSFVCCVWFLVCCLCCLFGCLVLGVGVLVAVCIHTFPCTSVVLRAPMDM